tara:strand:- start:2601 stop:3479 length:879 start_codon:yes stop_codon:yes gene_type:complete
LNHPATENCIVGCGDIGLRVARRLQQSGQSVEAIVRSEQSRQKIRESGVCAAVRIHDLDAGAPQIGAAHIYWFAPPPRTGDSDPRLRAWLSSLDERPRRVVYISTSGVYGDCGEQWIDEEAPVRPKSDRARRRADAEEALASLSPPNTAHMILRVPGIYGPGRMPLARLRKKLPVVDDGDPLAPPRWTNRIHSEDLADIAVAAMDRGRDRRVYNATDGHPSTMCDYFSRCAQALGLPLPPRISFDQARETLSPQMLSFLEESRRIHNLRIRDELGVKLRYPDLSTGLPASMT